MILFPTIEHCSVKGICSVAQKIFVSESLINGSSELETKIGARLISFWEIKGAIMSLCERLLHDAEMNTLNEELIGHYEKVALLICL